jgi:hypothetical protein
MDSTGATRLGGFGGLGGIDTLSTLWIGTNSSNASITVTPSNKQVNVDTAAGETYFGYNGLATNYIRGNTYFNGILYDEGNSAYYLNPAATTSLNTLTTAGSAIVSGTLTAGNVISSSLTANSFIYSNASKQLTTGTVSGPLTFSAGTLALGTVGVANGGTGSTSQTSNGVNYFNGTNITSNTNLNFNGANFGIGTTTPAATLGVQGNVLVNGTIRSSTGGFIFPDGTVQSTTASGQWTTSGVNIFNANTGNVGIGGVPTSKLHIFGDTVLQGTAGTSYFSSGASNYIRGNTYFNGILYDEGNSAYYLNPAVTSITNDLRANILYDQGNVGYYLDPASSSNLNGIAAQNISVASGIINSEWYRSSGNGGWYSNTHGGGIYMSDATYIRTYGSKSFYHDAGVMRTDGTLQVGSGGATLSVPNGGNTAVGYGLTVAGTGTFGGAISGTSATFSSSVTAQSFIYSDRTLKENIVPIESPLQKVQSLGGYTFNWKKDGKSDIGVIAQDVEKVFPELVQTDDKGIKTVAYSNLVAPLIEAVKELANSLDSLATRVFNTESRQTELEKQNEIQAGQIAELQRQINLLQVK